MAIPGLYPIFMAATNTISNGVIVGASLQAVISDSMTYILNDNSIKASIGNVINVNIQNNINAIQDVVGIKVILNEELNVEIC